MKEESVEKWLRVLEKENVQKSRPVAVLKSASVLCAVALMEMAGMDVLSAIDTMQRHRFATPLSSKHLTWLRSYQLRRNACNVL